MEWKDYVNEVNEKGFENASALARLIWSCETVNGIDQHAAPDLLMIADELAALKTERDGLKSLLVRWLWLGKNKPYQFEEGVAVLVERTAAALKGDKP